MIYRSACYTLFFASIALLHCGIAYAEVFTYAPQGCDVQTGFPEKPFIQNKCSGTGSSQTCAEIVSFTKVVNTESSLNVRVTCYTQAPSTLAHYTSAVMEETLKQMTHDANMEPPQVRSKEDKGFKKASALSVGERNNLPVLYTAQLWIGASSIFTIEAEMLGPQNADVEKTFVDILKNTLPKIVESKQKKGSSIDPLP